MADVIPRWMHRLYAFVLGYFWLPCPWCGRMFGGHEVGRVCPRVAESGRPRQSVCPPCERKAIAEAWMRRQRALLEDR